MLEILGLYKETKGAVIKNLDLSVQAGDIVAIECPEVISDLLFSLISGQISPGKGSIIIGGQDRADYLRRNPTHLGLVQRGEGLYERMTVHDYLQFFAALVNAPASCREIMHKLALLDIGREQIKNLSSQQRLRLSVARERLKGPKLLLVQEPLLNMDTASARIVLENLQELSDQGTAILAATVSYKQMLLLGGKGYTLDDQGLQEVSSPDNSLVQVSLPEKPVFEMEKISARIEDKIILFDPQEIDFIESEHGQSLLSVRGEKFPSPMALADLEARLQHLGFFRCHRSYLVNLQRVREVMIWTRNSYSLNLEDKKKSSIPLAKGRLEELKAILNLQ